MAHEKIEKVNEILLKGEPGNISVDEHADYTGYKPQAVVDAMNEVFWGEWGFTELGNEIVPNEKGGGLAVAKVEVWLKGNDFHPTGWGQNRVTRGDEGDARKGAQTDALKKALSYFGVGNRAYHGLLPNKKEQAVARQQANNQQQAPTNGQKPAAPATNAPQRQASPEVKPLQKRAGTLGLAKTSQEWMDYKARVLGHEVLDADLTKQQIDALSGDLTAREKKQPAGARS